MTDDANTSATHSNGDAGNSSVGDKGAASSNVKKSEDKASDVESLRDSDIKWRAKYKLSKQELEDERIRSEKEKSDLATQVTATINAKKNMEEKLLQSKLETAAISAGIQDLDLVKLINRDNIKFTEDGEIEGVAEAVADFKTKKPGFFGAEKKASSSTNSSIGSADAVVTQKSAWDQSPDEWAATKRKYNLTY